MQVSPQDASRTRARDEGRVDARQNLLLTADMLQYRSASWKEAKQDRGSRIEEEGGDLPCITIMVSAAQLSVVPRLEVGPANSARGVPGCDAEPEGPEGPEGPGSDEQEKKRTRGPEVSQMLHHPQFGPIHGIFFFVPRS